MALSASSWCGAAELYLAGDLRGSFVSPELGGALNYPPPAGPAAPISGEGEDRDLAFALALGVSQPLEAWRLGGRSLKGWGLRGEAEIGLGREYRLSVPGPLPAPGSEVSVHLKARTFLADFWLDFPVYQKLSGHVGFGLGVTGANLSGADLGNTPAYYGYRKEREFAFQVGAGLEYPVIDCLSVLASYRYVDLGGFEVIVVQDYGGSPDISGRIHLDLTSHELVVGLRLSFDFLPSPFD